MIINELVIYGTVILVSYVAGAVTWPMLRDWVKGKL